MKYQVIIDLGNNIAKDRTLISYHIDYEDQERSRFFKKNFFDGEKWENAHTHIMLPYGVNPRQFWYQAWHAMRLYVRNLKEQSKKKRRDRITGWRFEDTCYDPRGYVELDPKRLP